jgi:AcrR family transcriptional regulator
MATGVRARRRRPRRGDALPTRQAIVEAASRCIIRDGHARLSTRAIAGEAGVNQSLIHYHFGTKERLMLAVLERMTGSLLKRQTDMYDSPATFAEKWAAACRFYEQDLASGYVRLLIELTGLGFSNPAIGVEVRRTRNEWRALLTRVAGEALAHFGITAVTPEEACAYVRCFWEGMELEMMLGVPEDEGQHWQSLRTLERFLRWLEAERTAGRRPLLA